MYHLECIECRRKYGKDEIIYNCECGGLLEVVYDHSKLRLGREFRHEPPSVWKYRALLPLEREPVTLNEGGTPLYRARRLAEKIGVKELYIKHEGMNPTGSFKDRGMTVGVSKALELGARALVCASTGNTSASLSVYGARAGVPVVVLLPAGKVAIGKVAQSLMHGAKVLSVRGNFDDALKLVRELCEKQGFYLLNSINPYRLEGQKTIGFEIADQMGWKLPDRVVLPVGNAGNISAIYKGFGELKLLGLANSIPMMTGIQAEGACPVVRAVKSGADSITPAERPETVATAIRIGNPVNAPKALRAIRESGGTAESVSDAQILEAQQELARVEGIGVEPASASSLAGLKKLADIGMVDQDETVVCVTTGHLLKDPENVLKVCQKPIEIDPSLDAVMRAIGRR